MSDDGEYRGRRDMQRSVRWAGTKTTMTMAAHLEVGGRNQGQGWYGDPEGHSEAAQPRAMGEFNLDDGPAAGLRESNLVRAAQDAMRALLTRNLSVVTAESCTAGLISSVLSQAEGAASGLHGAFVVYTKEQKSIALGVPAPLLSSRGSVNEDVVRWMAEGALERSNADVALAVTGVLGPEEDEDGNPVGLVFLSCCRRGRRASAVRREFPATATDRLRHEVVIAALRLLKQVSSC
jgi:nicotinamide-nucleotide amidase